MVYMLINLHLDDKSLSRESDHWDISSKQSLKKMSALSDTLF